jgi:hypothetical protein
MSSSCYMLKLCQCQYVNVKMYVIVHYVHEYKMYTGIYLGSIRIRNATGCTPQRQKLRLYLIFKTLAEIMPMFSELQG